MQWRGCENGTFARTCFLPPGMTIEEAERIVAERRGAVISNTGENTGDSRQQMKGTGSNPAHLKSL